MREYFEIFRLIVFVGLVGWAAYSDLRFGRLPNEMNLAGVLAGLLFGALAMGWSGLGEAAVGIVAGAGPFLVVYLIGVAIRKPLMGAGDVKLMGALGAFTGPVLALYAICYGLAISGVLALSIVLVQVLRRKPVPRTIPFGAMLCAGAVLSLLVHAPVFSPLFAMPVAP